MPSLLRVVSMETGKVRKGFPGDVMRRHGDKCSRPAWQAMRSVPAAAAVPELTRLLEEKGPYEGQAFAIECLGDKGAAAKAAVPSLVRVLRDKPLTDKNSLSTH